MNNQQISNILEKELGRVFKGVYALDQITQIKPTIPGCYVINTKPIRSRGEHWIAIYVRRNRIAVYFDSFGAPPKHNAIIKFLKKHTLKWYYSKKIIQNLFTAVCGAHCIVFLLHFHRFKNLQRFQRMYGCDRLENDRQVLKFVATTWRLNLPLFITEAI